MAVFTRLEWLAMRIAPALLLFLVPAAAAAQNYPVATGPGLSACRDFARLVRQDPSMRDSFFAWAEGYMSGLNDKYLGTKAATNLLPPNESTDAQKQFLSDFCARHPEISYMAAVEALFVAMRRQQGLAK